jgi:predicted nicotinamide N-methyase
MNAELEEFAIADRILSEACPASSSDDTNARLLVDKDFVPQTLYRDNDDNSNTMFRISLHHIAGHRTQNDRGHECWAAADPTSTSSALPPPPYRLREMSVADAHALGSGHKVWEAATLLGRYLCERHAEVVDGRSVLELGAGCGGLPGIVASRFARSVIITDKVEELLANVRFNVHINAHINNGSDGGGGGGGSCDEEEEEASTARRSSGNSSVEETTACENIATDVLDWATAPHFASHDLEQPSTAPSLLPTNIDLILCCEVVYHAMNPEHLVNTIAACLSREGLVLVSFPDSGRGNSEAFFSAMDRANFVFETESLAPYSVEGEEFDDDSGPRFFVHRWRRKLC